MSSETIPGTQNELPGRSPVLRDKIPLGRGGIVTCVTLFHSHAEWIGVDIETGSFLRNSRYLEFAQLPLNRLPGKKKKKERPDDAEADQALQPSSPVKKFTMLQLNGPFRPNPIDPSRPEAIESVETVTMLGQLPYRKAKKLLQAAAAKGQRSGKILGNFGPSVAFMDLEALEPSVALIDITKSQMEIALSEEKGVVCIFESGETVQMLPLADHKCRKLIMAADKATLSKKELSKLLGGSVTHLLISLYQVQNGHIPKVVMSVLAPKRKR